MKNKENMILHTEHNQIENNKKEVSMSLSSVLGMSSH